MFGPVSQPSHAERGLVPPAMEPEGAPIGSLRDAVDTAGGENGFASPVRGRPLFTAAGGEKPADVADSAEEYGEDDDDVVGTDATEMPHEGETQR